MSKIIISIIIPVYNGEKYLSKCLDSIINQSYSQYEIIIIDDGSIDNSLSIAYSYMQKYDFIRVYSNKNKGVSFSRNLGIQKASGNYITFIDCDDWIEKDFLYHFVENIDNNPDYVIQGILLDWGIKTKKHYQYPPIFIIQEKKKEAIVLYRLLHDGCPVSKLFKKDIIIKNDLKFNENISMHEDHIFILDYFSFAQNIQLSSYVGYHYIQNNNPKSLSKQIHTPESLLMASDLLLDRINNINQTYNHINNLYLKDIYTHYGLSQRLRALLNAYKLNYSHEIKKKLYENEKRYIKFYKKWFQPSSISRFIYYYIFCHSSFSLFNAFNKILNYIYENKR